MMYGALQPILRALVRAPGRIFTLKQLFELLPREPAHELLCQETIVSELERFIQDGTRINGGPQTGYRFTPGPGRFHPAIFRAALDTLWWGQPLIYHEKTTSTMDELRSLAESGLPKGGLVFTEHQTAGRGRRGNEWTAPIAKDILCSFLLKTPPSISFPIAAVSMSTALAIADCLNMHHGIPAKVIWPNDLYVDRQKLAGILVEGPVNHENWIVGLGLNVYSTLEDWNNQSSAETLLRPRTSLYLIRQESWDRTLLLAEIGLVIETLWDRIISEGCSVLQDYWNRYSGLLGQTITILVQGIPKRGLVLGMDSESRLMLETSSGIETLALAHAAQLQMVDVAP